MKRVLILIFALSLFGICSDIFATTSSFILAPKVYLTGANMNVRFDVREALISMGNGQDAPPYLNTTDNKFYGVFYLSGAWWVEFNSWAYSVQIDCGGQPLSHITVSCRLLWLWLSENIGEVDFSHVEYIPTSWSLSGSIRTFIWNIPIDGVYIPLRPLSLVSDYFMNPLPANSALQVTVRDSSLYSGGYGLWQIEYGPKNSWFSFIIPWSNGQFILDVSLAAHYDISIIDPSGSKTVFSDAVILPASLDASLDDNNYFIKSFCWSYPNYSGCDGIIPLSATTLASNIWTPLPADGASSYKFVLKMRDKYGNRVNTGTVQLEYTTKTKARRILPNDWTNHFMDSVFDGDAVILSGGILLNQLDGTSRSTVTTLIWQDISYDIMSIAPTDTSDNKIQLQSVTYVSPLWIATDIAPSSWKGFLSFVPPYESNLSKWSLPFRIGVPHSFSFDITNNDTENRIIPNLLSILSIGDNILAGFRDFESIVSPTCSASMHDTSGYVNTCDWSKSSGSLLPPSVIAFQSTGSLIFTGTYTPRTSTPSLENISYQTYINYPATDALSQPIQVLYPSHGWTFWLSQYIGRIKILGQSNDAGEYGNLWTISKMKSTFIDTIRKNISMMSRNRTHYDDVPYVVMNGNLTVTGWTFDIKRTIIVIWGDISIASNITKKPETTALIALADSLGNGWSIIIAPSVTDVNTSLIAEHGVTSSGENQLYIYGSLIASNTFGDAAARICPYHVVTTCTLLEARKWDFAEMRSGFEALSDKIGHRSLSSRALEYPDTPMIIEYDARVSSSPPPGLE
jgi:hypothetical protein